MDERYYRNPPEEYWQGDIIRVAPAVLAKAFDQEVLRPANARGRVVYDRFSTNGDPPQGGFKFPEVVAATGHRTYAILLNHDCDFDKEVSHPRQLALVKEFAGEPPAEIVSGQQFRTFYLPYTEGPDFGPCYVDLRQITTVSHSVVDDAERILSLSDLLRLALRSQIARYFSRGEARA